MIKYVQWKKNTKIVSFLYLFQYCPNKGHRLEGFTQPHIILKKNNIYFFPLSVYLRENFFWEVLSKKIKGLTNFIVNGLVGNIYFLSDISDVKDVIKKRFHSGG